MRMLSNKAIELLKYLSDSPGYVTLKELMEYFNVSRRTIYNRLKEANSYLMENNLEEITSTPRLGYHLKDTGALKKLGLISQEETKILSKEERICSELWKLISGEFVSINKLAIEYGCTRNTIINDFKILQEDNPTLKLENTSKGKHLISDELEIRKIVFKYIQLRNPVILDKLTFVENNINYESTITVLSNMLKIVLTEKTIQHLANYLKFAFLRISAGKLILEAENKLADIHLNNFRSASETILRKIFPDIADVSGEAELLGEIMASSQALNIEIPRDDPLNSKFEELSKEIIFRFIQITTSSIKFNPALVSMLQNHLYSAYFRLKLDLPFYSSDIEKIQSKYTKIIEYTKLACRPLEKFLKQPLPLSELALISLYLGAINYSDSIIEKPSEKIKRALNSDVLIVCSSGIGTSTILHNELANSYPTISFSPPLEIKDLYRLRELHGATKATLVLTTTPIKQADFSLPIKRINAIMSIKDKRAVEKWLNKYVTKMYQLSESTIGITEMMKIISEYAEITNYSGLKTALTTLVTPNDVNNTTQKDKNLRIIDLLSVDEIIFSDAEQLFDLIKAGTDVLEANNIITDTYYSEIIRLIKQYGSYMHLANGVFLAHADPQNGSNYPGLSVVIPQKEIKLADTGEIKIIFVLAPGKNEEHAKALAEIVTIAKSKQKVAEIVKLKTPAEVYQYFYFEV